MIILDRYFHFGCKRRDDVDYEEEEEEEEENEAEEQELLAETTEIAETSEPDEQDTPKSESAIIKKAKKIVAILKDVFIPPKKEKRVHQHTKKKK